jgi:hypothetical protein
MFFAFLWFGCDLPRLKPARRSGDGFFAKSMLTVIEIDRVICVQMIPSDLAHRRMIHE